MFYFGVFEYGLIVFFEFLFGVEYKFVFDLFRVFDFEVDGFVLFDFNVGWCEVYVVGYVDVDGVCDLLSFIRFVNGIVFVFVFVGMVVGCKCCSGVDCN